MKNHAQVLLLEYLLTSNSDRVLVLEGSAGWLAEEIVKQVPNGEVLTLSRDIRDVQTAQKRLQKYPNAVSTIDVFPKSGGWDIVILTIPKERRYARTLLLSAWEALKTGGHLYLSGPNKGGAKAIIKDGERLFGNASILGYRKRQRVAVCTKGKSLPDPLPKEFQQPGVAPDSQFTFELNNVSGKLIFETHPGIFSWNALDEGTALLLENISFEKGSSIWDVGCGYGVIGLSAAFAGADFVAMSDINLIGLGYAKRNTENNGLSDLVNIYPADVLTPIHPNSTPLLKFDLIVSNPAFHQGHKVDKSMADELITRTPNWLKPHGRLIIVANQFLNYDKQMQNYFRDVKKLTVTNKFHVIQGQNFNFEKT